MKLPYTYRGLWHGDLKPRAVDMNSKFCRYLAVLQRVLEIGDIERISRVFMNKPDVKGLFSRPTYNDDRPPDEFTPPDCASLDQADTTTVDAETVEDQGNVPPAVDTESETTEPVNRQEDGKPASDSVAANTAPVDESSEDNEYANSAEEAQHRYTAAETDVTDRTADAHETNPANQYDGPEESDEEEIRLTDIGQVCIFAEDVNDDQVYTESDEEEIRLTDIGLVCIFAEDVNDDQVYTESDEEEIRLTDIGQVCIFAENVNDDQVYIEPDEEDIRLTDIGQVCIFAENVNDDQVYIESDEEDIRLTDIGQVCIFAEDESDGEEIRLTDIGQACICAEDVNDDQVYTESDEEEIRLTDIGQVCIFVENVNDVAQVGIFAEDADNDQVYTESDEDEICRNDVGHIYHFIDNDDTEDDMSPYEATLSYGMDITVATPRAAVESVGYVHESETSSPPEYSPSTDSPSPEYSPDTEKSSSEYFIETETASPEYLPHTETTSPESPDEDEKAAMVDLDKTIPEIKQLHNSDIEVLCTEYGELQKLGHGAYGMVYLSKCMITGELLVCKEICSELTAKEDMEIEAKLLCLLRATGVVSELVGVVENVRYTGNYGIIQRHVPDAVTLDDLLRDKANLDTLQLILVALNLATAVRKVHELQVIHNDIKPDNILVQKSSAHVRLIDFGLASYKVGIKCENGQESRCRHIAPESFHTKSSFASDVFSLGFVLAAINQRVGDPMLDKLVQMCRVADGGDRPSVEYVTQRLVALRDKLVLHKLHDKWKMK